MDRLIVLGGGESGVGAAILGKVKGYDVLVSDSGTLKDEYRQELERAGIAFEEGGHTENKVMAADLAIKSPGIPETAPVVVALREKGVPVISEIEFAGRYTKARKIGITGANGKTTTTLLTHHILSECGIKASLAGNVGFSMARQVAKGDEPDWYVIELSSFQLDDMFDFKCDVAILCNITPDHMDRYDHSLANYAHAKYRITQNMTKDEVFIYNADDLGTLTYFNNNYLGNVRQWQYMFFDKRYSFTPMMNPDYEQIASAYGIPSRTVIERTDLEDAVREMLETDGPFLLQCAVKEEDNVLPMTPPGANVDEMMLDIK